MFRTSFCAVPDFNRVEPAITSGPTIGSMAISTARASSVFSLQVTQTVSAPISRAYRTAPMVYGVRPLAATPTTASFVVNAAILQILRPRLAVVFRGFDRAVARLVSARDDALNQIRRDAEGRRAFRRRRAPRDVRWSPCRCKKACPRVPVVRRSPSTARAIAGRTFSTASATFLSSLLMRRNASSVGRRRFRSCLDWPVP